MTAEVLHQYSERDLPVKELNVCIPCKSIIISHGKEAECCTFCKEIAYCDTNCKQRNEQQHLNKCSWACEDKTNPRPYKEYLAFAFVYV